MLLLDDNIRNENKTNNLDIDFIHYTHINLLLQAVIIHTAKTIHI